MDSDTDSDCDSDISDAPVVDLPDPVVDVDVDDREPATPTVDLLMAVRRKAQRALAKADKIKNARQAPAGHGSPRFVAFVLWAGGLMHHNAAAAMARWRAFIPASAFGHFVRSVSIALLSSRVPRPADATVPYRPVLPTDLSVALAV